LSATRQLWQRPSATGLCARPTTSWQRAHKLPAQQRQQQWSCQQQGLQ
jgi:hypothetical protein